MKSCANCSSPLSGVYCSQCGQRDLDLERPFRKIAGEFLEETFDIDGPVFRTLGALLLRPGVLTRDYLDGHRKRYTSPVRLYLVISVLFFVVTAWVAGKGFLLSEGQTLDTHAAGQERLFSDYVPQLMFLLLPVFALLLKVAFRQRTYFHHLIHALHLHSAAYIVLGIMMPLEQTSAWIVLTVIAQLLLLAYLLAYFVLSLRRVYQVGWLSALAWTGVILLAYMMLVAASFEAVSYVMMPESGSLPFLTD